MMDKPPKPKRRPMLPPTHPDAVIIYWRIRNGTRVPGRECLPSPQRMSPKKFAAMMRELMAR